jgi:hypothetical protein
MRMLQQTEKAIADAAGVAPRRKRSLLERSKQAVSRSWHWFYLLGAGRGNRCLGFLQVLESKRN